MSESVLNSKAKKAVLGALLLFPKRSFTVQELSQMTRTPLRQVTEAARDLVRAEIAAVASRRGRRLYRLDTHSQNIPELKELAFDPKPRYEDAVARRLRSVPAARLLVLSGVFTFQPQLPVDILVVGDEVNKARLLRAIAEIEDLTGLEVNYAQLPRLEYDQRRFMNDRLIRDILDNPHIVVFNTLRKA